MRWTQAFIPTLREVSKDVEATSHRFLLKGGYIRKLGAGIFSYLPLGLRVLKKVSTIIREEMDRAGAIELLLPAMHPADIWKKTGRYETLGQDKIAFKNRFDQEFVLGPTHEEVITELASGYLKSHRDLPKIMYQIQTKFRDEMRPRFGIIRTKEFMMKDAYSFDADDKSLNTSYETMYEVYKRILSRVGLTYDIVAADPGIMGGNLSHEFMVRSEYGEDRIVSCAGEKCNFLVSHDIARRKLGEIHAPDSKTAVEKFETVALRTISELTHKFKFSPPQMIKTIIYFVDEKPVAVCVRGDHEVNEAKLRQLLKGRTLRLAKSKEIQEITGSPVGFSGPVGLQKIKIVADFDVTQVKDGVTGANEKDQHLRNVNYNRDFTADVVDDVRYVEEGDLCAKCGKSLTVSTSMEIGHVFKLGTRYSKPLNANFRTITDQDVPIVMGCYGIGVNRVMAAIIEQNNDKNGIVWPSAVAPYQIELLTVNQDDAASRKEADALYGNLNQRGFDVLYDDRNERAGVKFKDADLVGCPVQLVVSQRHLSKGELEIKDRKTQDSFVVPKTEVIEKLSKWFTQDTSVV
jgi:prolyl-tRNA synthetase